MIYYGDAVKVLRKMPAGAVQTCVTSPPYWGLRDYGTAKWKDGAKGCDHAGGPMRTKAKINANISGGDDVKNAAAREFFREVCGKCGARRVDQQIGLEPTPEAYVARIVEVFREVRRVLKDDGTLWLNLGDSYATGAGKVGNCPGGGAQGERWQKVGPSPKHARGVQLPNRMPIAGLKPKDLVGIPWRVAFALQADGWYLRSDIIWHKPNPMPESVRDRPTKAHEYLFLLAKSERYFYDADAIAEPAMQPHGKPTLVAQHKQHAIRQNQTGTLGSNTGPKTRNRRTVWSITPRPFKGAHFATFPPALVEPCVLAGSRPGDQVLDPFSGAGTTVMVARALGREGVGIELNREYIGLANARLRQAAA